MSISQIDLFFGADTLESISVISDMCTHRKAWSIEIQDHTASDWVVSKVRQCLLFENSAESIENKCKLANIAVEGLLSFPTVI
jgi:hypothetical protein